METLEMTPPPISHPAPAPELNLLPPGEFQEPLWKSLFQNLDDFFFPKKLPPLVLTSKPIPVKEIWGADGNSKTGVLGSTLFHIVVIALIAVVTILSRRVVQAVQRHESVVLVTPGDLPVLPEAAKKVGGGGGGGDRDKLQAPKGKLPKLSMQQITPPAIVVRNPNPKLAVEPTIVIPPEVKLASNNMPNLGDPMSRIPGPPSNGTGSGSGIGSGSGGGVGSGGGPGFGPGTGGGTGGGVFRVGGGVSAPRAVYSPDPDYSEEARKAKYQGVVVLTLIVGPDGRPRDIRLARTLGLGLDEKAMEAVKNWKFDPAMKDGKPVSVAINVEVTFHLY